MNKLAFALQVLTTIMSIVIFITANDSIWLLTGALMLFVANCIPIISTVRDKR